MKKNKNFKICILTGIFPPEIGGPATYVKRLANELSQKGVDVRVITYGEKKKIEREKFKIFYVSKKYPKFLRHFLFLMKSFFYGRDCDVVFAQNLFSVGIAGFFLSKIFQKRFVVRIVGDYAWEQSLKRGWFKGGIEEFQKATSFKINILKSLQKYLASATDCIITPSFYLKKIISGWGIKEEKIKVIYNAREEFGKINISKKEAQKRIGVEGDIILSVGRLTSWKGFDGLIEIMPDLLKQNPNFKLVIVGEGEEREHLKSLVSKFNLEKFVFLKGKVNHQFLPFYFKSADIFVLNTFHEGFPHVVLEAMENEVAVITTKRGGNVEIVEDGVNGILVEYQNKPQLKEAILKLWEDKDLRERLVRNAKKTLQRFNWKEIFEKTEKILKGKKKILFLGVTQYDFENFFSSHLQKKFEPLSESFEIFVLAKGRPFHKKIWGVDFYLFSPSLLFWIKCFFFGIFLCQIKKIDIIVAQSPLMEGVVGSILKKIFKNQLIVEIHGDWIEGPFLSKKRRFEKILKKIVPILAKISLKTADKIRGVSEYLIERAKKISPEKEYFLFPTFTDLDEFLNEKNISFKNFILFVGQLSKVKGVDILIEGFSKIEKEFPSFELLIVGEGEERKNLERMVKEKGLEKKIKFKGRLSLKQTKNLMKDCYFLCLPSLSEGLPRVLMESMSLRKPAIATNVGGIPELIKEGENGFLFEKGNVDDLIKKMRLLLKNKNLAIKMGERARAFIIQRFSNKKYIQNYIQMINN